MAVLMDILQTDQKDRSIKELLSDTGDDNYQKSTTRFPMIGMPSENTLESGMAEQETGLPESTEYDKDDATSMNKNKQSIDLSHDNKSLNSAYLSQDPSRFGERNGALIPIQKYRTKLTSQSQLGGENIGSNRNISLKFGHKSSGLRN